MTTRHQRAAVARGGYNSNAEALRGPAGCHPAPRELMYVTMHVCLCMFVVVVSHMCLVWCAIECEREHDRGAHTHSWMRGSASAAKWPARPSSHERGQAASAASAAKQPARPRRGHAHGRVPPPAREAGAQVHAWTRRRAHTHEGRACRAASADTPSDLYLF